jgi:hypothetical protein
VTLLVILVREPDAGKLPVRFDEREVETEYGKRLLSHKRGNPETEVSRSLTHRATSRLHLSFRVAELVRVPIHSSKQAHFRSLTTSATRIFSRDKALAIHAQVRAQLLELLIVLFAG